MAKYQLLTTGVLDTETNRAVPEDDRNRHWKEYLVWLGEGNTPDPVPAPPAPTNQQVLDMSDKKMIRAVDWLLEFIVTEGRLPTLPDIPAQLKALYIERRNARGN
jgi:hypothetical protein